MDHERSLQFSLGQPLQIAKPDVFLVPNQYYEYHLIMINSYVTDVL